MKLDIVVILFLYIFSLLMYLVDTHDELMSTVHIWFVGKSKKHENMNVAG